MSRDPALMLRATQLALRRESREAPRWARGDIKRGRRAWRNWYGEQIVHHASRRMARTPVECGTRESRAGAALELPGTGPSARHPQDPPFADNVPALSLASEKGTTVTSTAGVVVTTYNHAHFLDEALASIFGQQPPPDAVVVVDDGSSDDPAAIVRRFPGAQLIRQAESRTGCRAQCRMASARCRIRPLSRRRRSARAARARSRAPVLRACTGVRLRLWGTSLYRSRWDGRSANATSHRAMLPSSTCCAATLSRCTAPCCTGAPA